MRENSLKDGGRVEVSRLENAGGRQEGDPSLEAQERRRILSRRARALARREEPARPAEGAVDVVAFLVAEERYGFELAHVREILPLQRITPLPCTPGFVLGIANVRGEILSVIDLKRFFELPERGLTNLNKLIVLEAGDMALGVLADDVLQERSFAPAEIQEGLPTLTGIRREYLKGVTRDRLVILDAARILADPRIIVNEEVVDE